MSGGKSMTFPFSPIVLMVGISLAGLGHTNENCLPGNISASKETVIERCPANPDPLYDRKKVLEHFANVLNASAPGVRKYEDAGVHVEDEKPQQFFIFDLIDPSNTSTQSTGCVSLINKHIYHCAARYIPVSFSNVVILEDG
jgi:hypothetical protein